MFFFIYLKDSCENLCDKVIFMQTYKKFYQKKTKLEIEKYKPELDY